MGGRLGDPLEGPLEGPLGGPLGGRLVGQYHRVLKFWRTLVFHDAHRNHHGMDLLGMDLQQTSRVALVDLYYGVFCSCRCEVIMSRHASNPQNTII